MSILLNIKEAVITGNAEDVCKKVKEAIGEGIAASTIINDGLIAGLNYIGDKFKKNEVFIPEVLITARALHAGMDILKPLLVESNIKEKGIFVIGTVKGDLHDIGKNMVALMMEGSGFKVIDLGINVEPEKFIEAVKEYKPDIIGISALLTTTQPAMKETVEALEPYRDQVKIIVGGAPITQEFADEIGADAFAIDAARAVDKVNELLGI